jgi:hypothetical protein
MFGWNDTALYSIVISTAFKSTALLGLAWLLASLLGKRSAFYKGPESLCRLMRCIGMAAFLSACGPRNVRVPPANLARSVSQDYIDLQPGWRLTVVTPILKSGGYQLNVSEQRTAGNTVTLAAGTDFIGYEVAHYSVQARWGGGVRVRFSSAEVTKDGKTESQSQSIVSLFRSPRSARFIRLIYLIRVSQADHNMAVAAANEPDALDALTRQVQTSPSNGCNIGKRTFCSWIPEGIAVRPEALRIVDGNQKWVDAPR